MIIETFLKSAAAPAFGVAVLFLIFGHAPEPWRGRIQALFFTVGFWGGCYLLSGPPSWPPPSGASSLIWVAVWMMLFPWVSGPWFMLHYLFRGIWVVGGTAIAVWSLRHGILNSEVQSRNIAALVLLGWGMWSILERSVEKTHGLTIFAMPMISFTAASFLFLFKGSLLMSQMLTTAAVLIGALCLLAWRFPHKISGNGTFAFLSAFFAVFLIVGYIFMDIDPWLLMATAIPFGVLLAKSLIGSMPASALSEAFVCTVLSAVPLGYILWNVFQTSGPLY